MKPPLARVVVCTFLGGLWGCATTSGPRPSVLPTDSPQPFVAGYHAYWIGDSWTAYPFDVLDELFFFETEAGADGRLVERRGWPEEWSGLRAAAATSGVQVVPTVSMHDPEAFQALFVDADRIDRLVESTLALLAVDPTMAGIHLDFEVFRPVSLEARDGFTTFVAALRDALDRRFPGKSLSLFVLAFDTDDVYNEGALGHLADYLVVQGYDYFSSGSDRAGPLGATTGWAPFDWQTVVARFDAFGVPRSKIVMGVPLYGYEWPVVSDELGAEALGEARTVPLTAPEDVLPEEPRALERVREHGLRRDPVSGVPWYAFQGPAGWVQGWFDDTESLRAKYSFVLERGLGGIAFFPLAYGSDIVWEELRRTFR